MSLLVSGEIKATGVTTFRKNLKKSMDDVYQKNLALIVTRPEDENVVVISETQFNELQKEINNLKYLLKLAKLDQQLESGESHLFELDNM